VAESVKSSYDHIVLVLQGGGAQGAYQAGVFEGMAEHGYAPNWIAGVSIGAINGALIAGNPPEHRVARLKEFWELVSSSLPAAAPTLFDPLHGMFKRASAALSAMVGVPGFYAPRVPPAVLLPDEHRDALGLYDTSPLKATLERLPAEYRDDADVQALTASSQGPKFDIVHLINRHYGYTSASKDNDFSLATVMQHWEDGLEDARRTIAHPEWLEAMNLAEGIRQFDLAR
jgi:hypothetical protein